MTTQQYQQILETIATWIADGLYTVSEAFSINTKTGFEVATEDNETWTWTLHTGVSVDWMDLKDEISKISAN